MKVVGLKVLNSSVMHLSLLLGLFAALLPVGEAVVEQEEELVGGGGGDLGGHSLNQLQDGVAV